MTPCEAIKILRDYIANSQHVLSWNHQKYLLEAIDAIEASL